MNPLVYCTVTNCNDNEWETITTITCGVMIVVLVYVLISILSNLFKRK